MTEQTQNTDATAGEDEATAVAGADADQTQGSDGLQVDELALLKQRARLMGVEFSNNISLAKLKEKIAAKQAGETVTTEEEAKPLVDPKETGTTGGKVKTKTLRQFLVDQEMKLVRLRITNLDPKKKDLPGEIFTVANEYLGTVRKFVPFGEVTENGYHVPYCIYEMMKSRKFLNIRTRTDRSNGNQIIVEQHWAQEFALEVLDPLTPEEIAKLAAAQTAAGGIS